MSAVGDARKRLTDDREAQDAEAQLQADEPGMFVDPTLCAEHRDGEPGEPHEWRRGRRGKTRVVTCSPRKDKPVVLDLDDPYFHGQSLPDVLRDHAHVHSTTGVCVKAPGGEFCQPTKREAQDAVALAALLHSLICPPDEDVCCWGEDGPGDCSERTGLEERILASDWLAARERAATEKALRDAADLYRALGDSLPICAGQVTAELDARADIAGGASHA